MPYITKVYLTFLYLLYSLQNFQCLNNTQIKILYINFSFNTTILIYKIYQETLQYGNYKFNLIF